MAIIAPDLGIDLGTSNTLVYVRKKGILINEPTLLVVQSGGKRVTRAIGRDASVLVGRTPAGDVVVRPMQDGRIRDYDMAETLLKYFIRKAIGASHIVKPRAVITIPCRVSKVDRRVITEAAVAAGIRRNGVELIEKPFASAYGSDLRVFSPEGTLVVDSGGGTTEIALITHGGYVATRSLATGGISMDMAIVEYLRHDYNMVIGDRKAEDIKIDWGAALPYKEERKIVVSGRDLITGLPQTAEITSTKVYEALQAPCRQILQGIRSVLDKAPPELAADVLRKGVFLMGGASQLHGLDHFLAAELGLPVTVAKEPMLCAAMGVGRLVDDPSNLPFVARLSATQDESE
jgi:rod shape-determining protein MreB